MSRSLIIAGVVCLTLLPQAPASAQYHAQRGAALGGIAGAITGGVIGDNNDEAGVGAVIGGALGAVTGAVLGDARDQEEQMARAYQYRQAVARSQQAVSLADVVNMSRSGLGETVIVNQIRQRGVQNVLEVQDIIFLHEQGVGESAIAAMQQAAVGGPPPRIVRRAPAPPPVIVQRYYQPAPLFIAPPPRYHRHHHTARWGMSFGY